MSTLQAIILGIVQGLTEFLPVSSSGHLVLGQHLFGLKEPDLLFDVIVHVGTLAAVLIVFRRDIRELTSEAIRLPRILTNGGKIKEAWRNRPQFKLLVLIILGSIPTGLMGVFFKDFFETLFASILAVGCALLFTGTILFLTGRIRGSNRRLGEFRPGTALIVGIAQGLAITPGVSRSGLTISTGMFCGLNKELSARYSFLLSIPAILGALILQLKDASPGSFHLTNLGVGFCAALVAGLGALTFLLRIVRRGGLHYFSYYCWMLGLITIGVHFFV